MPKKSRAPKASKSRFERLHKHPFVIPVITFLVLFFVSIIGFIGFSGRTVGASDILLVSLTIDGEEQKIPTRASSVADLLKRLDINLGEQDIIEPAPDTPIEDDNLAIKIYKARPVLVEDSGRQNVTYTAEPNPAAIAEAAGIQVYPEDKVSTAPVETSDTRNFLKEGIVAEKIVIDRAALVNLNLYGTSVPVRTHANTVGDLIAEKNVQLNEGDTLQPDPNTPITNDTQVFVTRFGTQITSEEQVIPPPVEFRDDPNLTSGSQKVQQAGSEGRKVVTYELEITNGKETGRRTIQEVIAAQPVKKVVVRGTKVIISNPSANVETGRKIASDMGWSGEFSCIYSIFERESKWNHLARNRNTGAYGIPQALPGSKMGPGWESDPAVQIRWGINYMVNRYGSPCKANSFWQVNHWY